MNGSDTYRRRSTALEFAKHMVSNSSGFKDRQGNPKTMHDLVVLSWEMADEFEAEYEARRDGKK